MTYFSAIPVPETTVGIAIETVRGTPEPPAYWLPIMGPKYKPDLQLLPDEGLRGSMVTLYDEIPGLRYDSHAWDSYPYLDSFPVFERALLGSADNLTAAVPGAAVTELFAEAKPGDKKIITVATLVEGVSYVIDFGTASAETVVAGKPVKLGVGEWEAPVAALAIKHEAKAAVTAAAIKLTAEAKVGAKEIAASTKVAGGYLVIGVGAGKQETVLVTEEKAGKLVLAYPLVFTHAIESPIVSLTSHAFSLQNEEPAEGNQPPSCSIVDFAGEENWRQLARAQLNALTLTGSAESLPKAAMDWFADRAIVPSPTPTPAFSVAEAPPGWTAVASVGGVQIGYLVSWEFGQKRGVKNIPAVTGSQKYYQHFAGALDATAKITVLEDPEATWLTAFENGELESIDFTLSDVESGFALNLHSSKAKFTQGSLDRSKEWVEVPLDVQLIPSEADALAGGVSPIVATIANAQTTAY